MRYRLVIKLLSSACPGSGSGWGSLIDTDIVHDDLGLPYIPAKRIKGIIRENTFEVLNAMNLADSKWTALTPDLVTELFGARGTNGASPLKISNAYRSKSYDDYILLRDWLLWADANFPGLNLATPERVLSTFAKTRQQTAITDKGIAMDNSLRITRVLNGELQFYSEIEIDDLCWQQDFEDTLALGVQVTRSLGNKRNRGFGQIACQLKKINHGVDKLINISDILDKFEKRLEALNGK